MNLCIIIKTLFFILYFLKDSLTWNYAENSEYGPKNWVKTFPQCGGQTQSPINVDLASLKFSTHLISFELPGYESIPRGAHWEMHNNGHYLQIRLKGDYIVKEGGLNGQYKAIEMNLKWGLDPLAGSEHSINGSRFPMELQILHHNTKYASYDEALSQPDGLAAFSFLFRLREKDNPIFMQVINNLDKVKQKDSSFILRPVPLLSILPINLNNYFRYDGSLTNPPCSENVLWTIFTEIIDISRNQLMKIRKSLSRNEKGRDKIENKMATSQRNQQRINERIVYSSRIEDATIWTAPLSPISITLAVFLGFVILFLLLGKQHKLDIESDDTPTSPSIPSSLLSSPSNQTSPPFRPTTNAEHHLD